jgi:AraC family transcriptional regulator of adaptative response / DNA-3-methyladenine glycosylase II
VPGAWDPFELAVRAVLGQQVSLAAARTLCGRLVARCGRAIPGAPDGLDRLFPTAAELRDADLSGLGILPARVKTLGRLAEAVASGRLVFDDLEAARRGLAAIPGIGPFTVEYVALRALGDPDAFPAGDLHLRRALGGVDALDAVRPLRAYAALYLWNVKRRPS